MEVHKVKRQISVRKAIGIELWLSLAQLYPFNSWSVLFWVKKPAWQEQVGRCHHEGSQSRNLLIAVGSIATSHEDS